MKTRDRSAHHTRSTFGLLALLLACAAVLPGCGQQDLYEPPGAPWSVIGRVPLPSVNESVDVLGTWVYVAGGQAGLHVIDIADPTNPVLVKTINTTKYAEGMRVVRTFANQNLVDVALVVEGTEGITTYDVTDPPKSFSFNQGTTAVDGQKIFVLDAEDPDDPFLVFLAESWKGIRIFESNPQYPGVMAYTGIFAGTNGYARGITWLDGYIYVADDEMGLAVIDARDMVLGAVELVSSCDSPGLALDIDIENGHACVADGYDGISIFAIDAGTTPVLTASLDLPGKCRAIVVRDDIAVLAASSAGVHFVDVSNPSSPVYLGTVVTSDATDVALCPDGNIVVADEEDGMLVLGGHGPFTDTTRPSLVTSLDAQPHSSSSILLSWFAPGDDHMLGTADSYEIRTAATAITDEAAWDAATAISSPPAPGSACTEQTFIVTGLSQGETYHYALKAVDESGNWSALSNTASAETYDGIILTSPAVTPTYGTDETLYSFTVTYLFDSEPTSAQVIIDGSAAHAMTQVSGQWQTGAQYAWSGTLARGAHTFEFAFEATDIPAAALPPTDGPLVGAIAFVMGSPEGEAGRRLDEDMHGVALTRTVEAAALPVTQAQWTARGLENLSANQGSNLPVENITFADAVRYCLLLTETDGLAAAYDTTGGQVTCDFDATGWRLPTEAEWEYLCRAGSADAFSGGDITVELCGTDPVLDGLGWYCGNSGNVTHEVGLKSANHFGLYDMHGNVKEWCWDWYAEYAGDPLLDPTGPAGGFRRVVRGGSADYYARECRSAARGQIWPTSRLSNVGMRVVRTISD